MRDARRKFLTQTLAAAGLLTTGLPLAAAADISIPNVSGLYTVKVARAVAPTSTAEVCREVLAWPGKVAIGGGRYSMGGQAAIRGGLHLDMRGMNKLVHLDPVARVARVQAGMRWRDLQVLSA